MKTQSITSGKRKCLLWEGVQPTEADSKIEEEHLLNFVVNSRDEELAIDLGENVKVTTEKLYEVLAGAIVLSVTSEDSRRDNCRSKRPRNLAGS